MCAKWNFVLENLDERKEFEKIIKENNIVFSNEIFIFKLK